MTHKRFVKLLMAKGYSRNEANKQARNCTENWGLSNQRAYDLAIKMIEARGAHRAIERALIELGETAMDAAFFLAGLKQTVYRIPL